jgi:hypothetical protein
MIFQKISDWLGRWLIAIIVIDILLRSARIPQARFVTIAVAATILCGTAYHLIVFILWKLKRIQTDLFKKNSNEDWIDPEIGLAAERAGLITAISETAGAEGISTLTPDIAESCIVTVPAAALRKNPRGSTITITSKSAPPSPPLRATITSAEFITASSSR